MFWHPSRELFKCFRLEMETARTHNTHHTHTVIRSYTSSLWGLCRRHEPTKPLNCFFSLQKTWRLWVSVHINQSHNTLYILHIGHWFSKKKELLCMEIALLTLYIAYCYTYTYCIYNKCAIGKLCKKNINCTARWLCGISAWAALGIGRLQLE